MRTNPNRDILSIVEIAVWCLFSVAVLAGILHHARGPRLGNDSYQYLSEAENIGKGLGLTTSIVHFDSERASGRIPAPVTTFPPGYSLAVSALSRTGMSGQTAGLILSLISFISLVPLIVLAAGLLELNAMATRMVLILLLSNAAAEVYATSIATESLFTMLSMGGLVCLLRYERGVGGMGTAAAGTLLIGFAYCVRYAGLFVFIAAGVRILWRMYNRRDRRSMVAAACLAVPASLIGWLMVRNTVLMGSWKGGNTKIVSHPLGNVLKDFVVATYHLFFGETVAARAGLWEVLFVIGFLSLLITAALWCKRSRILEILTNLTAGTALLLIYAATYSAGMIYLHMFSVISFGSRYLYPLLPVYLLLLGVLLTRGRAPNSSRLSRLAWVACTVIIGVAYCRINLRNTMAQQPDSPHLVVEASFAAPGGMKQGLRAWFNANVPVDAVLVATNGQATAYALGRKTISLIGSLGSTQSWSEFAIRDLMNHYGADYLILYPGLDATIAPVQQESPFVNQLIMGLRPPWLQLAAENSKVLILRRSPSEARDLREPICTRWRSPQMELGSSADVVGRHKGSPSVRQSQLE